MSDDLNFVPANTVTEGRIAAPRLANLEPDQFWFVLRISGYEPDLLAWVETMNEPKIWADIEVEVPGEVEGETETQIVPTLIDNPAYDLIRWAAASTKVQHAKFFERDHPFVVDAQQGIGMTTVELDALWIYGLQ